MVKIFDVLFREKPSMMLVTLLNAREELYATNVAKIINRTYSHVVKTNRTDEKGRVN